MINESEVKGEESTGYEGPDDKGPFACHNCEYYRQFSCGQKTMMQLSKLPRVNDGRVQVSPLGCCEYVSRREPGTLEAGALRKWAESEVRQMPGFGTMDAETREQLVISLAMRKRLGAG